MSVHGSSMHIGEYLKSEREKLGITLEQVADITKISFRHLKAMEDGRLEVLPSKVFVKGFIKAYSKSIGLNPADVLYRYDETLRSAPASVPRAENPKVFVPAGVRKKEMPKREPFKLPSVKISGRTAFFIIAFLVILLSAVFSMK